MKNRSAWYRAAASMTDAPTLTIECRNSRLNLHGGEAHKSLKHDKRGQASSAVSCSL
jgi:hypothetical protein